jgi:hypothetical protein
MPSLSLNIGLNGGRKLPFGGGAAGIGFPITVTSSYYGQMQRNSGTTGNQTGTPGFIASKWYYYDNTQINEDTGQPYGYGINIGLTTGNVWYYETWYWEDGNLIVETTQSNANPSTIYTSFPTTNWTQYNGVVPGTFTTP